MVAKKTASKKEIEIYEGSVDEIEQIMADMGNKIDVMVEGESKTMSHASALRLIKRGRAKLIK